MTSIPRQQRSLCILVLLCTVLLSCLVPNDAAVCTGEDERKKIRALKQKRRKLRAVDNNDRSLQDTAPPTLWCWWMGNDIQWHEVPRHYQLAAGVIGEDRESWDNCLTVTTWELTWDELSTEEQQAARVMGFTPEYWDEMDFYDENYVCNELYTLPPTPAPGAGAPCLSGMCQVEVFDEGSLLLEKVKVGDRVLVAPETYQEVYSFGHVNVYAMTQFLQIFTTQASKQPLEISGEHLVVTGSSAVRADSIKVGDVLVGSGDNDVEQVVTAISSINRPGLYSPLTRDGILLVNGVQVSSYTATQNEDSEHFMIGGEEEEIKFLSHHWMSHMAMAPLRTMCLLQHGNNNMCNERNSKGQLLFAAMGETVISWIMKQAVYIQIVVLLGLSMSLLPVYLLEQTIIMVSSGNFTAAAVILAAVVALFFGKSSSRMQKRTTI